MEATKQKTAVRTAIGKGALIKRLLDGRGTTFVGMTATTDCRMNKGGRGDKATNRLHNKVEKRSRIGGIIGFSYDNMVNKARVKEATTDGKTAFRFADEIREACLLFGVTETEIADY